MIRRARLNQKRYAQINGTDMLRIRILERIGFKYIANKCTKEIHRIDFLHKNCKIKELRNGGYCTKRWAERLIKRNGYNGCRWCWREKDTG